MEELSLYLQHGPSPGTAPSIFPLISGLYKTIILKQKHVHTPALSTIFPFSIIGRNCVFLVAEVKMLADILHPCVTSQIKSFTICDL